MCFDDESRGGGQHVSSLRRPSPPAANSPAVHQNADVLEKTTGFPPHYQLLLEEEISRDCPTVAFPLLAMCEQLQKHARRHRKQAAALNEMLNLTQPLNGTSSSIIISSCHFVLDSVSVVI